MNKSTVLGGLRLLSTDELLALAVGYQRSEGSDGDDIGALVVLHERATPDVFTKAAALSNSSDASERAVCARVLRELGHGAPRPFSGGAVLILASMARVEADPDVLQWIVSALAWQGDPASLGFVLPFAHHPDSRVRHAVAVNPFGMVLDPASADPRLIEALIDLSGDIDADTRWYATYSLANEFPGDGAALREALANRLSDPDEKVRSVARDGLVSRHDPRVEG